MTGRVDWGAYSGEDIENIIAIFFALENPGMTYQIQPSRGDGGIDVVINQNNKIDAVQVKKFSRSPNASQFNQIKKSMERFAQDPRNHEIQLNSYILVMPAKLTPEFISKIKKLAHSLEIPNLTLLGLSEVEAWASKYPEVVDYYLFGQRDTILKKANSIIHSLTKAESTDFKGLLSNFESTIATINSDNPNYTFYFSSRPAFKNDREIEDFIQSRNSENLVRTEYYQIPGHTIIVDLYAKHGLSLEIDPISLNGKILLNDSNKEEVESFFEYGTPFKSKNIPFKFNETPKFSTIDDPEKIYTIHMFPNQKIDEVIIFRVVDTDHLPISTIELSNSYVTCGIDSNNLESLFVDKTGSFKVRFRYNESTQNQEAKFLFEPTESSPIKDLMQAFRFFQSINAGNSIEMWKKYGKQPVYSYPVSSDISLNIDLNFTKYIESLSILQEFAENEIKYTDAKNISSHTFRQLILLRDCTVDGYSEEQNIPAITFENELMINESNTKGHFLLQVPLFFKIDWFDSEIEIGLLVVIFAGTPTNKPNTWELVKGSTLKKFIVTEEEKINVYRDAEFPDKYQIFGKYVPDA